MFALSQKKCFSTSFCLPSGPQICPPGGTKGILLITIWAIRGLRGLKKHIGGVPLGASLTFTPVFRGFVFRKGPFGGSFRPRKLALNGKIRWEIDVASRNTRKTHRLCDVAFEKITKQCRGQKGLGIKQSRLATCGIAADCYFQTILKSLRN